MTKVEFDFNVGDKVSILLGATIGMVTSLCLDRDGTKLYDVQYPLSNGEIKSRWMRFEDIKLREETRDEVCEEGR